MKKFVYTTFQVDSLPFEPQGKPRNTRAGSLSLLQWIFLTQELNQGLLHCRWIPYQLSYQESPKVKVAQSCLTLRDLKDHTFHRILQARIQEWVAFPFSRGSSQPSSLALQADSLPAEPQRKPKNTGVGGLTLLQRISPTQDSEQVLLHCRQIYQLSYQGDSSKYTISILAYSLSDFIF